MFACSQGGGNCIGVPDVCLVPPGVPKPFTNSASPCNGTTFVPHIFTVTGNAHNQGTIIASSMGDAPGTMGGVSSGTILGISQYITCSNKVLTGGMPTARMTSITQQNNCNAAGAVVSPSQTKVLLLAP